MILPTDFPKPNLTKIQSSPIISQPSQSQSSPISPISISSSGPIISLSQSPKLISPSPHPICNKKIHSPIKNAFPLSSFFFLRLHLHLHPANPLPPPMALGFFPSPGTFSPTVPRYPIYQKKKCPTYTKDTEPIAFLKKSKVS
jgi:hypothetical protein